MGDRPRILRALFRAYFASSDGRCTKDYVCQMGEKAAGLLKDKPEAAARIQAALQKVWTAVSGTLAHQDPDVIKEEEFVTSWITATAGRSSVEEKEDWLFLLFKIITGVMDTDGDGSITIEEFTAAKSAFSGWPKETAVAYFNKMDADGSGSLDKAEVTAAVNHMFFGSDVGAAFFCPPHEYGV